MACTKKDVTYKDIVSGIEGDEDTYHYYCPKGKEKYKGGLSAGAIAGIVIACLVVVGVIVFCICYFLVCKKGGCNKKSSSPVEPMKA